MSLFSDIPIRSNADTGLVNASWWNAIRTALIAYAGTGVVDETQYTINGTTGTYTATGLVLSSTVSRATQLAYTVVRDDGTTSRREMGYLHAMFKNREGTWYYERESYGDDALGNGTVADSLRVNPSTGSIDYKADNFASGTIKIKSVIVIGVEV